MKLRYLETLEPRVQRYDEESEKKYRNQAGIKESLSAAEMKNFAPYQRKETEAKGSFSGRMIIQEILSYLIQ